MHRAGGRRPVVRRLAAVLGLGTATVVAAAGTSWAAPSGHIVEITPNGDHLSIVYGANELPPNASIDPTSVVVTIGGKTTQSSAKPVGDTTPIRRIAVMAFDISASMSYPLSATNAQTRISAAKQAAHAYLDSVPPDVQVGLVTFTDQVAVVQQPTTDRGAMSRAVDALSPANNGPGNVGGTKLYDGTLQAVQQTGSTGIRNVLVLSDGKDNLSTATLPATALAVHRSGVHLDAVGLSSDADIAPLRALAAAGGGTVIQTDQADNLAAAFTQAATSLAKQVVVEATVPDGMAGSQQRVVVDAKTSTGVPLTDSSFYLLPAGNPSPTSTADYGPEAAGTPTAGTTSQSWFLPVAVAAVGLGLFAILGVALVSTDREGQVEGRVRRRLSRYSLTARSSTPDPQAEQTATALGSSAVARSAVELAGRVTQQRDFDTELNRRLEAGAIPLKPAEWMLIHVGLTVGLGLLLLVVFGFSLLAGIVGLLIGLLVPLAYLNIKESRRKAAFSEQLPDTLQLLSGSLAAGYSLPQAVDTVVKESSPPMSVELNKALVEARLGVPLEEALDGVARRMGSVDFSWVVMAIRINREVGGNLAEVLSNVAATMRERARLRRQVQVLSAEGRLSGIILLALPVIFLVYLVLVRPGYLEPMLNHAVGLLMIVIGVVLMIAGAFWMRKVVNIDV